MAQLIKHGTAAVDTWKTLEIAEGETPESVALPTGDPVDAALSTYLAHRMARARGGRR